MRTLSDCWPHPWLTIDRSRAVAQDSQERDLPMASAATNPKQEAHELIERISTAQASAVVTLITTMLDPVDRAIANAPFEDELISDEENRAVAASKAWLAEHPGEGTPHEEMLREFGINPEDLHR
ncbi:MAG TPA: hypothetical protein VMU71_08505 [Terracidiphilus sp.]|nr:hypothetical protein [Terracidiphilus sp.]